MGILFRSFDFAPRGASLRISAADSRSPAARDRSRLLAPQFFQILRLRALRRFAQDFGSRLPLSRRAGSLTPANASIFLRHPSYGETLCRGHAERKVNQNSSYNSCREIKDRFGPERAAPRTAMTCARISVPLCLLGVSILFRLS